MAPRFDECQTAQRQDAKFSNALACHTKRKGFPLDKTTICSVDPGSRAAKLFLRHAR